MLNLNSLLAVANIDPAKVLVMRHRPFEPKLRKWLPTIAVKKPELYRAYQQAQYPRAEAAMSNAEYVASFVGLDDSRSVFCYLYANRGSREINEKQFWKICKSCLVYILKSCPGIFAVIVPHKLLQRVPQKLLL